MPNILIFFLGLACFLLAAFGIILNKNSEKNPKKVILPLGRCIKL
jgi:hypothetical protein